MECYNLCFYSSLVFLFNIVVAYYYEYYVYSILFFLLMMTSLYHHSHYTLCTRIIDKIAVYLVVFYGGYLFYNKINKKSDKINTKTYVLFLTIITTFLSTILLYYYGYVTNSLCYCDDNSVANYFHSFMHCIGSLGHACIVIL